MSDKDGVLLLCGEHPAAHRCGDGKVPARSSDLLCPVHVSSTAVQSKAAAAAAKVKLLAVSAAASFLFDAFKW